MFRFLRLRYWVLYALVLYGLSFLGWQWLLETPVRSYINHTLSAYGYNDPAYKVTTLTGRKIQIDDIRLDTDGINTVQSVTVTYSPWTIISGRVKDITIIKSDFIFGDDAPLPIGGTGNNTPSFRLRDLPFENLKIQDLSLSYATDTLNPSIGGDIEIVSAANGTRTLLFGLKGAQKDFTLVLNGRIAETDTGVLNIKVDIPEARIDTPDFMMSRAHGKLELDYAPGTPISANGEWVAGAMRAFGIPLDNVSIIAQGRKPDFSVIGNAGISGVPMSNISLRIAEDATGAQALIQLSGETPQKLADTLGLGGAVPVPETQKFVATVDMKDNDLLALFSAPHRAGVFLYDQNTAPFLSVGLDCAETPASCAIKIPETSLQATQINRFLGPLLAQQGLQIKSGGVRFSGTVSPFATPTWAAQIDAQFDTLGGEWQSMTFSKADAHITRGPDGTIHIKNLDLSVFGGTIAAESIVIDQNKNAQFILLLNNLDLTSLSKFARINGLAVTGRATGRLPLRLKNGAVSVDKGGMINGIQGTLKYTPKSYPPFLTGTDDRMGVLRGALENYKFDSLQLDFAGDPMGTLSATLAAKGRNEALFGKRPIHINLKIDGPLAPAIKQLLPYVDTAPETEGSDE